jgi:hypothetical protein
MIKTFTQQDLVRRLYLETSEEETREIDKALLCDSELQRQYKELAEIKKRLGMVEIQPSEKSTKKILEYAKSLQKPQR